MNQRSHITAIIALNAMCMVMSHQHFALALARVVVRSVSNPTAAPITAEINGGDDKDTGAPAERKLTVGHRPRKNPSGAGVERKATVRKDEDAERKVTVRKKPKGSSKNSAPDPDYPGFEGAVGRRVMVSQSHIRAGVCHTLHPPSKEVPCSAIHVFMGDTRTHRRQPTVNKCSKYHTLLYLYLSQLNMAQE